MIPGMMRLLRIIPLIAVLVAGAAVSVTGATPAGAFQQEICQANAALNPEFPCLNAWNGGPYVKSYSPGVSNENFAEQDVFNRCESGSALTTNGCPIAGIPAGYLIVQLRYSNGQCVGDLNGASGDAHAALTTCNNPNTGQGGAYGTIFVARATSCSNGDGYWNAHWSSNWNGSLGGLRISGNTNGSQFWLNVSNSAGCLHQF
jgi:hypothetical protein